MTAKAKSFFAYGFTTLRFLVVIAFTATALMANSSSVYAVTNPQTKSLGLQAEIPTNPPTTAATITFPSNGQIFTNLPIKVGGSCPADLLIKIFKNGIFGGSAQCANGSYSLTIDLFDGKNDLIARDYDALDQAGPDSSTVTVSYNQGGFNTTGPRVSLTSAYAKRGANPKEKLTWPITLSGGTSPYAVGVDWGDSNNDLISRSQVGDFNIEHTYDTPGIYTVIVKATDTNGNSAYLQLVAVGNGALSQTEQSSGNSVVTKTTVLWWPMLIAVAFVGFSFWLGGRFKLENLRREADKRIQY